MKIGIVGYQGSGKSTLFHWLTGMAPDPALAHATQSAMATIPDPRVAQLCEIYKPKKITQAVAGNRRYAGPCRGLTKARPKSWPRFARPGALVMVVAAFGGN